jgi:cytochrome bd-type quinol oxidase subunit 2
MAVFRFIAFLLIVAALMLLGADVVSMLESGEPRMRSIEIIWALFAAGGAEAFKTWATATLPGPLPEGVAMLLSWPAWAVLGVTGVLLAILFRQRDDVYD